ncbi:MAG: histidine triad nucleotide-binding protein, partial [Patescibacteria group bacterium]|nr:histidine triad nucleotide-binding protein [Patescibacteria group bacterium]
MDDIFCKIIRKEIPKEFIYESENLVAFEDINPSADV